MRPADEIHLAMDAAASHQESIRHADTKVTIIATAQGCVLALAADHLHILSTRHGYGFMAIIGTLLITVMVTTLTIGVGHLLWALHPQVSGPSAGNRLGFPGDTSSPHTPIGHGPRRHCDEAWDLVAALARIAQAKHRRIRRGMPWMVASIVSGGGLLLIAALAR